MTQTSLSIAANAIIANLELATAGLVRLAAQGGPEQRRYERIVRALDDCVRDLETLTVREQYRTFRDAGALGVKAGAEAVRRTVGPTLARVLSLAAERKAKLDGRRDGGQEVA